MIDSTENEGRYARKQLHSPSKLIAFSHRRRFELARLLAAKHAGKRLLDYGCGDGTFLRSVAELFPGAVGADIDRDQLDDCAKRLAKTGLVFKHVEELRAAREQFDVVFCMETLEHCLPIAVTGVLRDLVLLTAPRGQVVISVPIEIGPTLALKQLARQVMGWRKIGDYAYTERYTARELLSMLFAGERTGIERPAYPQSAASGGAYHGHKGFNWKALRAELIESFHVGEVRFSPFGWSRGLMSSQVWFLCTPR